MEGSNRNTIQKTLILKAVLNSNNHPTAEEIYRAVKDANPHISRGTVYRNLGVLAESGMIKKIEVPNGRDRFDHTVYKHHHFLCTKCDSVFDYDFNIKLGIERLNEISENKITDYSLIFKGICSKCLQSAHE